MPDDGSLSLGRIAKLCNVSRTTAYRWIVAGHLKSYALPSGHFRVRSEDLTAFCKAFNIPDPQQPEAAEARQGGHALDVVIADDHPDMVLVLRKVVERFLPGATIHAATNGVDTCIAVGTVKPHLLLLDIMMPAMDGFSVLQELLRRPELQHGKVIVVSAYEPFERVEELGRLHPQVAATVRKPIGIEVFGRLLQQVAARATATTATDDVRPA